MIHSSSWKLWWMKLATDKPDLVDIVKQMKAQINLPDDSPLRWSSELVRCLDLLWARLEIQHKKQSPEMACQRSGRCCHKQVPRVSVMEITEITKAVMALPVERRQELLNRCRTSTQVTYADPVLGTGVPCPMLETTPEGKFQCAVHKSRPYICRASGVTGQLSWDCPLWQVHQTHFPTLSSAWVDPFLDLFGHCRAEYSIRILGDPTFTQMALLGAGVLGVLEMSVQPAAQPEATALIAHKRETADVLWKRDVGIPNGTPYAFAMKPISDMTTL